MKRERSGSSPFDFCRRACSAVTALLLFWLTVTVVIGSSNALAQDAIRIDKGEVLISDAEMIPADGAGWQPTAFPHRTSKPDNRDLVGYWYRASFKHGADTRPLWLLFPKLRSGGTIYVNGIEVGNIRGADASTQVRRFRPFLVFIPATALHSGSNKVAVHFAIREPLTSFGDFTVGSEQQVRDSYERLLFWEDTSTTISIFICLIFGALTLAFWLRRRQERLYGILAACAMFWGVRTFVFRMPVVPMDYWVLWRFFYYFTTAGFIVWITIFILHFSQSARRNLIRFLLGYWLAGCLAFLLIGAPARLFMDAWWTAGFLPFTVYSALCLVRFAIRQRTASSIAMVFAILFALALSLHDYAVQHGMFGVGEFYLLHLGIPAFLLVMACVLLDRFVRTLRQSDLTAEQLAARVSAREAELAQSYEKLRRLERAHATAEERQRITQDMHDGVGSQLLSTLLMMERGAASQSDMVGLLRECLDDMRLVIDSLSPDEPDLVPILGNLRFRMEPRLASTGLASNWIYCDLPDSLEVAPRDALQILRIMQEALTNVQKHADARQVSVQVCYRNSMLELRVSDDGVGFDPTARPAGRGLINMRSRAARIGAELSVTPSSKGTVVLLRFNASAALREAA